jgi:hypothetical protein
VVAVRPVLVEWVDSRIGNDWVPVDDAKRTAAHENAIVCVSVGFLVEENAEYVLLAGTSSPPSFAEKELVNGVTQIPACAVRAVKTLTVGRRR